MQLYRMFLNYQVKDVVERGEHGSVLSIGLAKIAVTIWWIMQEI